MPRLLAALMLSDSTGQGATSYGVLSSVDVAEGVVPTGQTAAAQIECTRYF